MSARHARPAARSDGSGALPFRLAEASITDLRAMMDVGTESSQSITQAYIERIETIDRHGPRLHSVFEVNPDALDIATALDDEMRAGSSRGPLHGIPILLKDNIGTADRMTTTAGSTALLGSVPPDDSFVAARLRAAGAVLLGKTNMGEWAGFMSFVRGTVGWSGRGWDGGRGGLCRNPYALDRAPGGSSSG